MRALSSSILSGIVFLLINIGRPVYACDFPPKGLLEGKPTTFKGSYRDESFQYIVVIPPTLTGYSSPSPTPQHGFGLIVGGPSRSYIMVNGEANSGDFDSPFDEALQSLRYLRQERKQIESVNISGANLGGLNAVRTVARYSCQGSPEKYVLTSTTAISPDKAWVYEVALYTRANDKVGIVFLDEILKSWRYLGR
jgi:hypothetical protein